MLWCFFFQAEDGIRDYDVTGVQTCALPILLVQDSDLGSQPEDEWKVVTDCQPTDEQMEELRFGWAVIRHVKSNAITLSKDLAVCGVGAGQMSRVDSVDIAIKKAGDRVAGSVLASDAFFPFPDSIEKAAQAGVDRERGV